jgi:threonyl-tRNA synthetase
VTVNDKVSDYVSKIANILDGIVLEKPLKYNELRYTVDDSADSLGKKIKRATDFKIPVLIIVGPKDAEEGIVSLRLRDKEEKVKLAKLADYLCKL